MLRTLSLFAFLVFLTSGCASRRVQPPAPDQIREPKPGLVTRSLNLLRGSPDRIQYAGMPKLKYLAVGVSASPDPVRVSAGKFDVTFGIRNNAKKQSVNLAFDSTQRIEVVLLNDSGTVIQTLSTGRSFSRESGYLVINPKEEASYTVTLPTKNLSPGRTYSIESYFVGYDKLVAKATFQTIP